MFGVGFGGLAYWREMVVETAFEILEGGAHYLWGAQSDGRVRTVRPNSYDTRKPDGQCLFASSLSGDRQYVCAGRSDNPQVAKRRRWAGRTLADAETAPDRESYVWPRYYRDADTVNPGPSGLVFGESCWARLHFDCAGFVRQCFRSVLGAAIIPTNISMRQQARLIWQVGKGRITDIKQVEIYPADLLYTANGTHVGLATGSPEHWGGTPGQAGQSIHAFYARVGVVKTPIDGKAPRWAAVYRWGADD